MDLLISYKEVYMQKHFLLVEQCCKFTCFLCTCIFFLINVWLRLEDNVQRYQTERHKVKFAGFETWQVQKDNSVF